MDFSKEVLGTPVLTSETIEQQCVKNFGADSYKPRQMRVLFCFIVPDVIVLRSPRNAVMRGGRGSV